MRIKQILAVTLLVVCSLSSQAADYYIATTALNVRNGAGKEYSIAFALKKGDEVEVIAKSGDWYKIKYFGKVGYSSSKYFKYSGTISDAELHTPQQRGPYLLLVLFVCFALLLFFDLRRQRRDKKLLETATESNRGDRAERDLVLRMLKFGVPAHTIFHDLYVEKQKGNFSQIDLVAVTDVGILVFEVKNYSGWIFGSGNQSQWTKVLAYGKQKYRFYNPILQNHNHIAELRKKLIKFGDIPFYSVVVFYGNCVLKEINYVPEGTFLVKSGRVLDVVKLILEQNNPVHYTGMDGIFQVLRQAVTNGGILENQRRHKENIEDMLGKNRIFD